MGLWRRLGLRAAYIKILYRSALLAENFSPFFDPIFDFGGIFQGLGINFELSTSTRCFIKGPLFVFL